MLWLLIKIKIMIQLAEILDLSVSERILMVEQIWDSINKNDIPVSSAQKAELDQRLNRYELGETKFFKWSDIKHDLHKR